MRFYENMIKVRVSAKERYKIHQLVDTLVQERLNVRFPYSFLITPFPNAEQHTLIRIRSSVSFGIAGEVAKEISFKNDDPIEFICKINDEKCDDGKYRHRTDEEVEYYVKKNAAKHGFSVVSIDINERQQFQMNKPSTKKFTLGHAEVSVVATISDPALFETSYVEGLGKKRMFGFGYVEDLKVAS